MYPVVARQLSLTPTSLPETQPDTTPETQQASTSSVISFPVDAFIAQNGAHPILSGVISTPAGDAAQDSLLREAKAQMSDAEALAQQAKAAEAQEKAKVVSIIKAVIAVVVAEPAAITAPAGSLIDDLPKP